MDGLLEILPFIIFIIAGIIKAISGGNSEQKEKQQSKPKQPNHVPKPTATPSGGNTRTKQTVYESTKAEVSIEEQKQQQMERLASRMNTDVRASKNNVNQKDIALGSVIQDEIKHHDNQQSSYKKEQFKKQVKNRLNGEGLINGVIMSEVLGPPRARKPYRNVLTERRR
ncbi:hypothetical protein [Ornithinibacillus xuwenensis]|uniref:Uncharacterized protein n=1 Tax=Ornithinibacillus xuwenensis TaxID=3144668 RepID=A0ABU9XCG1_9BACI